MLFTLFFSAVYNHEWLVLQTIYVLNKEIYSQERVIMVRVWYVMKKIFISFLRTSGDIMNLFKSFYFLFDND